MSPNIRDHFCDRVCQHAKLAMVLKFTNFCPLVVQLKDLSHIDTPGYWGHPRKLVHLTMTYFNLDRSSKLIGTFWRLAVPFSWPCSSIRWKSPSMEKSKSPTWLPKPSPSFSKSFTPESKRARGLDEATQLIWEAHRLTIVGSWQEPSCKYYTHVS